MGEREGFEFKDGTDGLGYYKLLKKSTTKIWTRHRPDDACSPPGGSIATGPRKHRSGGFNPVEQAADEQQRLQQARFARQQHQEQGVILQRMQRGVHQPGTALLLQRSQQAAH